MALIAAPASFLFGSIPTPLLAVAVGFGLAVGALSAIPVVAARGLASALYMLAVGPFEAARLTLPTVSWFPGQPALIMVVAIFLGRAAVTVGANRYIASRRASPRLRDVLETLMHDEDKSSFPSIRRRGSPARGKVGSGDRCSPLLPKNSLRAN